MKVYKNNNTENMKNMSLFNRILDYNNVDQRVFLSNDQQYKAVYIENIFTKHYHSTFRNVEKGIMIIRIYESWSNKLKYQEKIRDLGIIDATIALELKRYAYNIMEKFETNRPAIKPAKEIIEIRSTIKPLKPLKNHKRLYNTLECLYRSLDNRFLTDNMKDKVQYEIDNIISGFKFLKRTI